MTAITDAITGYYLQCYRGWMNDARFAAALAGYNIDAANLTWVEAVQALAGRRIGRHWGIDTTGVDDREVLGHAVRSWIAAGRPQPPQTLV